MTEVAIVSTARTPIGKAPNDPQGPGKGYRFKDASLSSDGTRKLLYKGGGVGQSKAMLIARGPALPTGLPAALQSSTEATVQLRSSDGLCLTANLTDITQQDATTFKAK